MSRVVLALLVSMLGCTKDTSGNPFGSGTAATMPLPMDGDDESDASGDGESSSGNAGGSSSSSGAPGSSSGEPGSSSGALEPTTSGVDPTGGADGQPATGQYSHCLDASECVDVTLCVQIQMDMKTVDGFCSTFPCANAAVDCDPAPGGTAVPFCFPMTVNGMATTSCALDCGAGQTCPTGMQCFDLESASVCA
jgi:hypothetical protein